MNLTRCVEQSRMLAGVVYSLPAQCRPVHKGFDLIEISVVIDFLHVGTLLLEAIDVRWVFIAVMKHCYNSSIGVKLTGNRECFERSTSIGVD